MNKKTVKKGLVPYVFIFFIMITIYYCFNVMNQKVNVLSYNEFVEKLSDGSVARLEVTPRDRAKTYEIRGKLDKYKKNESFFVRVPLSEGVMKKIIDASEVQDFKMTTVADPESSSLLLILINVLPIVLLVGVVFYFFSRQMAGNKNSMDFGKSKARLNSDNNKVTLRCCRFKRRKRRSKRTN